MPRAIIVIVVCSFLGALAGCAAMRSLPIYNVENAKITTRNDKVLTLEQVGQSIEQAAVGRGWVISDVTPGHMVGTMKVRGHMAAIDIAYTPTSYSITYKDSIELLYTGTQIHRTYNKWIELLQEDIDKRLRAY